MIPKALTGCLAAAFAVMSITQHAGAGGDARLCDGTLDFGNISDGLGTVNRNINSELVQLLEARSGCRIRTVLMPAKRVTAELRNGTLHMSGRYFQTPERDEFLWFAHIQRSKMLGWFRSDDLPAAEAPGFMTSDKLILGVTVGFSHAPAIDRMVEERRRAHPDKTIEFPDRKALLQGLLAGRADVVLLPASIVEELNPVLNHDNIRIQSVDPAPDEPGAPGGIVFSKKLFDAGTAARWQALVAGLCEDGSVLRIFRKYFRATEEDLACTLRKN
jgi:polar amino acid transport system substrate-binding protein